ncbi:hypothetical protein L917_11069 [Phytophthora nicotianae]|uniref:HNH nuclease domain-containing protein n=1 Tax=Phytophthora nicotianae TaxID=4792 RepID=W2KYD9_PHYNI|nr:hypothetical protein L917_11069 [Phytophthora nicotianae]
MKVNSAKEMKAMEADSVKEVKAIEANSVKEMKAMDLAWKKEKAERQEAEKVRDREFWAEQNNKNRKMYVESERWNNYLDMRVYGTPSKQYITSESLFDNLDFRVFDAMGKVDASSRALLLDEIKSAATTIPVWEQESARACEVVDVDRVSKLVDDVMEKIEASREALREAFQPIQELLGRIPAIASRDDRRFVDTEFDRSLAVQSPDKHPTMKTDKRAYIREANRAYMKGGDTRIRCYCCHADVSLKSSACHRSHNIPRSAGGDWSADNVYLCCATCNADMADRFTVLEYKVELFIRELRAMQI